MKFGFWRQRRTSSAPEDAGMSQGAGDKKPNEARGDPEGDKGTDAFEFLEIDDVQIPVSKKCVYFSSSDTKAH